MITSRVDELGDLLLSLALIFTAVVLWDTGRPTVYELVAKNLRRLDIPPHFLSVGRLDYDSEGYIHLTGTPVKCLQVDVFVNAGCYCSLPAVS